MNRDEAERCVDIALGALRAGDAAKAQRLALKAQRMHPSQRAADLLATIAAQQQHQQHQQQQQPQGQPAAAATRRRSASKAEAEQQRQEEGAGASEGDRAEVQRVLRAGDDYYAILGLQRGAELVDVKRSYKKLALRMHPDKNHSPGAEDAFKKLAQAYACLSDEQKRAVYDRDGVDPSRPPPPRPRDTQQRGGRQQYYYTDDVDPDEIFRAFFFGSDEIYATTRNGRTVFHRRAQQQRQGRATPEEEASARRAQLAQLLVFLVVAMVGAVAIGGSATHLQEPDFSLVRSAPYVVHRTTARYGIEYYVRDTASVRGGSGGAAATVAAGQRQREYEDQRVEQIWYSAASRACQEARRKARWGIEGADDSICDEITRVLTRARAAAGAAA
eukprot:m51a1_g7966 hypothetical protein (388) ;mRNA; f:244634-246629